MNDYLSSACSDSQHTPFLSSNFPPDNLSAVGMYELHNALRLARESMSAAEWLFSKGTQLFHGRNSSLPPEAFSNALAVHMRHNLTPSSLDCSSANSITKDMDMLFVPVAKDNGITFGYSFMLGVQQETGINYFNQRPLSAACSLEQPSNGYSSGGFRPPDPPFIAGRFVFHHKTHDLLVVSPNYANGMTGVASMRWRNKKQRDQAFFLIPTGDYGPDNLPYRVISVQSNVDQIVRTDPPSTVEEYSTHSCDNDLQKINQQQQQSEVDVVMSSIEDPSSNKSTYLADNNDPFIKSRDQNTNTHSTDLNTSNSDPTIMGFEENESIAGEWPEFLDTIGTSMQADDPSGMFPNLLNALEEDQQKFVEELERIFSDNGSDLFSRKAPDNITPHPGLLATSPGSSLSSSDPETPENVISDLPIEDQNASDIPEVQSHFITGSNPDGVSMPRTPSNSDTSAGAFDLSTLTNALSSIEESLQGSFFSKRIRKDTLHVNTGELVSRTSGRMHLDLHRIQNPFQNNFLRQAAAQFYYTNTLPINPDMMFMNMNMSTQPLVLPTSEIHSTQLSATGQRTKKPGRAVARKGRPPIIRKPSIPILAPRPIPVAIAPTHVPAVSLGSSGIAEQEERDAKLEAKRIKNRLSAAKSNQKRRAQLEAQKRELAILREKVDELEAKKMNMEEDNERLRLQIFSE